jgi:hypothetical protein
MKKILVLSAAALTVLAISGQKASAWCDWKFGVGLNLAYRGGGNNFLWGAYKSQQPPAPGIAGLPGPAPVPGAVPVPAIPGYAPPYGGGYEGGYGAQGAMGYYPGQENPAPSTAQTGTQPTNKVQPVDYQVPAYGQYGYGVGYYQSAGASNYAPPPSYWYGK